jgi:hypothetical protein
LAPYETEKESAHRVGAGNIGAPATVDSFPLPIGKNSMMVINLYRLHSMRKPLGTSGLKEGEAGSIEE